MNVVVTGGLRGIGLAIVKKQLSEGNTVIATYTVESDNSTKVLKELEEMYSGKIYGYQLDLAREESVVSFVEKVIAEHKECDLLVNNGGITNDMLVMKMTEEDFTRVINVNLTGTFLLSKYFLKYMAKNRRGNIINIASIVGITGNAGQANYAASKAGIIAVTKSMAKEYGRRKIRVNAVAPGFIKTDMTDVLTDDLKKKVTEQISLGELGTPEQIADVVSFLGSENASYITGQTIVVDGGMI